MYNLKRKIPISLDCELPATACGLTITREVCMKKKIIILAIVLLAALAAFFTVKCIERKSMDSISLNMYFLNGKESTLVADEQTVRFSAGEDITEKVLDMLVKGGSKGNGIADKKTTVNSIEALENGLTVDFSKEFLTEDVTHNTFAAYAVVKTLSQLPGVKAVRVTVNGKSVKTADGTEIGFLSGDDINLEKDSAENKYAALYFADKKTGKLKKEIRKINTTDSQSIEQCILNELIKGPKNSDSEGVISPDTSVISVQTTDGTCFVNFSSSFVSKNSGSKEKEMNAVYSVVNSLTELDSVKNVQFLVEGKKSDSLGNMSINGTFCRNDAIIEN